MGCSDPNWNTALVLGLGVIGGSLARALTERKLAQQVIGYALPADIDLAMNAGAITSGYSDENSLVQAIVKADLIVLALPVSLSLQKLLVVAKYLKPSAIVTDVCSVKQVVCEAAKIAFANRIEQFVPSHPIAGSHLSGFAGSRANLFEGATVAMQPAEKGELHRENTRQIAALWSALGASVRSLSAREHDEIYALISHLPHMAAFALLAAVQKEFGGHAIERLNELAGSGFRDSTRIGASDPQLWADIALNNREALSKAIGLMIAQLQAVDTALMEQEPRVLLDLFSAASSLRQNID